MCIVMLTSLLWLGPPAGAVDEGFVKWIREAAAPRYGEVAERFVAAAGRDGQVYRDGIGRLHEALVAFVEKQGRPTDPAARCALLARFLFEEEGFQVDLDLTERENLYPDAILERRRGYCLGLTLVLLDLGERLSWPLVAVSAPRHTFVRYQASTHVNIETTLGGQRRDDEWYQRRYGLSSRAQLVELGPARTAAHLLNNHGFVLLAEQRRAAAALEFDRALAIDAHLVEAIINRGVVEAREGRYCRALKLFDRALERWPGDLHLRLNRANVQLELGHIEAALTTVRELLASGTPGRELAVLTRRVRDHLDPAQSWDVMQELTRTMNQALRVRGGRKAGLRGTYFEGRNFQRQRLERIDRDLSFQWRWGAPARELPKDNFSVRWQGWLEATEAAEYRFLVACSDGVRIRIDGRLVVDAWHALNDNFAAGSVPLEPGLHDLEVEYFESIGESGIKVMLTASGHEYPLKLADHLWHAP